MLAIKLRRQGKKHQASFRVVVAEKRSKLGGKFVDDLGWYDPHSKNFEVKKEKVEYWMKVGARPTDSAHNLLVRAGVIDEPKIAVHSTKKKKKEEEPAPAKAPAGETAAAPTEGVSEPPVAENKEEVKEEEKAETPVEPAGEEKKEEAEEDKPADEVETKEPAPEEAPKEEEPKVENQ